jgi:hypothetical protein
MFDYMLFDLLSFQHFSPTWHSATWMSTKNLSTSGEGHGRRKFIILGRGAVTEVVPFLLYVFRRCEARAKK